MHSGTPHRLTEDDGTADIIVEVAEWLLHRLPHRLEAGEVKDGFDRGFGEDSIESLAIENIDLVKFHGLARELLDPFDGSTGAVGEVVDHYHIVTGLEKDETGMTADIACPPGDQYAHQVASGTED
jgi:hypothetical protein